MTDLSSEDFVDSIIQNMPFRTLEMLEEELCMYGAHLEAWGKPYGRFLDIDGYFDVKVPATGSYFQRCYHRAHELGHLIAHGHRMRDEMLGRPKDHSDIMMKLMHMEGDAPSDDEAARDRYLKRYLQVDREDPEREFVASVIAAGMLFPQSSSDDGETQQLLWGRHRDVFLSRVAVHYRFEDQADLDRYQELVLISYRDFEMKLSHQFTRAMSDRESWIEYCKFHGLNPFEPFGMFAPVGNKWHFIYPPFGPDDGAESGVA